MKLRFGIMLSLIGTVLWTTSMFALNQRLNEASASQAVAGVATVRSNVAYLPETTDPLVTEINQTRTANGAPLLLEDTRLNGIAKQRLEDMRQRSYYAHVSPEGTDFVDTFASVGIDPTTRSCENLLLTSTPTTASHVEEWSASPSHTSCMLSADMSRIGVAYGTFDVRTGQIIVVTIYAHGI